MALNINTNIGALGAAAAASSVNKSMETSMTRLSTGLRVNTAADDAAGVAIASRLTSEIRGTNMAIRNAMDGQAMIDTAEGAHNEITNILQRMRELAVQAANDTNDANDRSNLQAEIDQLTTEINRIADATTWAGQKLLNGTGGTSANGTFNFQVGTQTGNSDVISVRVNAMDAGSLGVGTPNAATALSSAVGGTLDGATLTLDPTGFSASVSYGDQVFSTGIQSLSVTGGTVRFEGDQLVIDAGGMAAGAVLTVNVNGTDYSATIGAGGDDAARTTAATAVATAIATDYGWATAEDDDGTDAAAFAVAISRADLATDLASKLNANSGFDAKFTAAAASGVVTVTADATMPNLTSASNVTVSSNVVTAAYNAGTTYSFDLDGVAVSVTRSATDGYSTDAGGTAQAIIDKIAELGIVGITATLDHANGTVTLSKSGTASVSTLANAQTTVDLIDAAINTVNTQRANLGAVSNRLDSTVSNLTNISTNLEAGRSRIQDADFAAESTNLAKSQILQQASMAMLAQANASKQGVLSLLQG